MTSNGSLTDCSMSNSRTVADTLLQAFTADELTRLRDNPFAAISEVHPQVRIQVVDYQLASDCSVEGEYHEPTRHITVHQASSYRRTKFTALHEFGHDQARHTDAVARLLATQVHEGGLRFEESVANAFAAAILVPEFVVDDVVGNTALTADTVVALFRDERIAGSREACCVRVAQRMRGNGYVLLAQADHLLFVAAVGSTYAVASGAMQGHDHLVARAGTSGRATADAVTLRHRTGTYTPPFAGQAVEDDGFVFAVLTDATRLPWGGWTPPVDRRPNAPEVFCEECDAVSEAWQRCEAAPSHRVCSTCGWCLCRATAPRVAEQQCNRCFLTKRIDLFVSGSTTCLDCD